MVAPLSLTSHKLKTCVFYVPSYKVISPILDSYFLDEIDFNMVINKSTHIHNVLTYNKWIKSKKIDDLLK